MRGRLRRLLMQLRELPFQKSPLRLVRHERERAAVSIRRLGVSAAEPRRGAGRARPEAGGSSASSPAASSSSRRRRPSAAPLRLRHRGRVIQRDDRRRMARGELAVERGDLLPVGVLGPLRLRVERGDGRLQGVVAGPPSRGPPASTRAPSADLAAVPAVGGPGPRAERGRRRRDTRASRRESWRSMRASSARASGVPRHERGDQPRQANRLRAQLRAHERLARRRGVAFVEDQVEHDEHRVEPFAAGSFAGGTR